MNFIKCEKLEKSMAELQFSIDAEAFKAAVADVFKKEGKKYAVPGFRKGKAPRALIEKMYGADVFTYDAINELFPDAYEAAVKEAGIEPVGRPEVTVDSASETEGVTLTVKVAVKPEVEGRQLQRSDRREDGPYCYRRDRRCRAEACAGAQRP